jgi:Sulfotransferase domain
MSRRPLLGYFGHHKCASTWIENICGSVCHDLGLRFRLVYTASDFDADLPSLMSHERVDFLAYANADYRHVGLLGEVTGFHVVRDPRDVVVSAYFSHLYSHPTHAWPELISHRAKLQSVPKEEGLFLEMDFRAEQFREMESWPDTLPDNLIRLRMEDLTADPYNQLLRIMTFLKLLDEGEYGAPARMRFLLSKIGAKLRAATGLRLGVLFAPALPAERLLGIAWENHFARHAGGRTDGEEDVKSHYRKGTPGDWLNHFNRKHIEYFKERYSGVLLKYGYEADDNWDRKYLNRLSND